MYTPYVESRAEASGDPTRYRRELDASQPIGRMGQVRKLPAVAYLASDEAAFVTGSAMESTEAMTAALPRSGARDFVDLGSTYPATGTSGSRGDLKPIYAEK